MMTVYRVIVVLAVLSCALNAQVIGLLQGARNILTYSTYLGGSSNDTVHAMAVDSQGSVYLAGETASADFPVTAGAFQQKNAGKPGTDCNFVTGCYVATAFVTKLDQTGKIVYSTYLGGSGGDAAVGIAVDALGNAYVAGTTGSADFPVTPGGVPHGSSANVFVTKLNPSGSALVYSTLVGGSDFDGVAGIRIDAAGNAYVAGTTNALDFPTTPGALQTTAAKAQPPYTLQHGFVFELNAAGSALIYSTYLSGSQGSNPDGMTLTSTGEVLVIGQTSSTDFPITKGAYQTTMPPSPFSLFPPTSHFISRLNADGSALVYSTFFGGLPNDFASWIEVDDQGAAYVTGDTFGSFPATPGAFTGPATPDPDALTTYLVKLSPDGSHLVYAVPFAVGRPTGPGAVALDRKGNVWLTGGTSDSNFPITPDAYQSGYADSVCFGALGGPFAGSGDIVNCGDAYLTELDSSGSSLIYSTYFGSNGGEGGTALAIAPDGSVYVAGTTTSAILPATASALQTHRTFGYDCTFEASPSSAGANPCTDVFVSRFNPAAPALVLPFEVVNSASYLPGALAPGEFVTLFGPGIGPAQSLQHQLDASGRLATTLGGIRVLFDQTPAPLLFVGADQINAIVPYDTAAKQQAQVVIQKNGIPGPAQQIELANVTPTFTVVAPGVFTMAASGIGQAAAFNNKDGTRNGPAHPAAAGSVVGIYATGLGVTDKVVPDGTITSPSMLPKNIGTVEVFVGGTNAQVLYAGAAAFLPAGISQVNFVVPTGVPSGNQAVFVSAGHVVGSQSGVWIAMK